MYKRQVYPTYYLSEREVAAMDGEQIQFIINQIYAKKMCIRDSPVSLGDVFPLRCHSAIYGAFGSSYAGNPSSFHDIPLGELYAGRPAGYLCPAVGGGAADLYGICGFP